MYFFSSRYSSISTFIQFLCTILDQNTLHSPTIERLVSDYLLGSTRNKEIIYWQVDTKNRIRTGKIQAYNPHTGKRIKGTYNSINWVHAKLKKSGHLSQDWQLTQCLFGEPLLSKYPDKHVALVEGEKNAIIGSAIYPEYIWLATGGKQNFKPKLLRVLSGRIVLIFPDTDALQDWTEKSKQLTFYTPMICDHIHQSATSSTYDLSDYLISELQNQSSEYESINNEVTSPETNLQTLLNTNPVLQTLIDSLQLKEIT